MGCVDGKICSALATALSSTLETLAFAEIDPLDVEAYKKDPNDNDITLRDESIWAQIPFVLPFKGYLTILLVPDLANNLTEGIYGFLEKDMLSEEVVFDSIAEISNILAGQFCTNYLGDDIFFELGLPDKGRTIDESEIPVHDGVEYKLDYSVEGFQLTVILVTDAFA
jgi:CheY-specific phosphatase CheX